MLIDIDTLFSWQILGYTDTLINVLKSGKLEQPEIVERSYTGEEKCARFIYVVFFLFGWNFFFKITLIVITGTKFLNLLGYQQVR